MTQQIWRRLGLYGVGLFIMTIGVALSVKSHLGVSPISSLPYTLTVVCGVEMGKATMFMHACFVGLEILILRRQFEWRQLFQVVVGVIFGYFTTLCNWLVTFLPDPHALGLKLAMTLGSTVLIAVGIFFYVPADLIPLAGEGLMGAIATQSGKAFSSVKIVADCTMVVLSAVICLLTLHTLGSVGLGTVIAALLVGSVLKLLMKRFGQWRYALNGVSAPRR